MVIFYTDNHSCNVSAFCKLKKTFQSDDAISIKHPQSCNKTYLFFDSVHLLKNIRNNLLNNRKFVFPSFSFNFRNDQNNISCDGGYIAWSDLNYIFDKDSLLSANLRKAHCLSCKAWMTVNSKKRFSSNELGNALVSGDDKIHFWLSFANWLGSWKAEAHSLCFSKQTFEALQCTLLAHANICQDLFKEGYEFIIMAKFQTDQLKRRFSQYRQMNGGRFLVSLREVVHSENILLCRSLLKERINFWEEDLSTDSLEPEKFMDVLHDQDCNVDTLELSTESKEVGFVIAGYVAKKLKKRLSCTICSSNLIGNSTDCPYFLDLSRGNLTVPSASLTELVCQSFALLDLHDSCIRSQSYVSTRQAALCVLKYYLDNIQIFCNDHFSKGLEILFNILVNIFCVKFNLLLQAFSHVSPLSYLNERMLSPFFKD